MPTRPILSIIAYLLLLTISCTKGSRQASELERQAERMLSYNPDSAIMVVDSALRMGGAREVPLPTQVRLLLIRQQAYADKRQMDSVISTGVRIRRLAVVTEDSLSIARSLLPVRGEVSVEDQRELEPWLPGAARTFAARDMRYEEAVIEGLTGAIYTRKGRFAESMQHLYRARVIQEGLDSVKPLYAVYMNIGNNLSGMGDLRGSTGFYRKACEVARRQNDSTRVATALMNEGAVLLDMGILDSSRILLYQARTNLPAKGGEYARLQIDFNLATVALRKEDLAQAEVAFRNLVDQANAIGDPFAIGMAKNGLAGVLGRSGRLEQAISIMEATIRQQEAMGMGYYNIEHTQNLISLYSEAGRYREALSASKRLKQLSDSMLTIDKQKAVRELSLKYDFEKQESEKNALQGKLRQRNLTAALLAVAVLGLSVLGVVFRQRNRYHRELNHTYVRLLDDYRAKRDRPDAELPPPVVQGRGPNGETDQPDEAEASWVGVSETGAVPTEDDLRLHQRILSQFNTQKSYLKADLKLEDLALSLDVPARRVSDAIKAVTGQGYSDYVNRFRIAEATRTMDATDARELKLEYIAHRCGFKSRQHFRRVFEQVTGVNPSFYRSGSEGKRSV